MNNANFGNDCRNNANNTKFEPLIDEINEISYIKKYYNLFDSKISNFVNSEILENEIEENYNRKISVIKENDPFKNARIAEIENTKKTEIDTLNCLKEKEKRSKKRKIKFVDLQIEEAVKNKKIKSMIEFDKKECNSIKSVLVKKNTTIDVSTRFIKGKMLMFAKLSLKSFVYDMIDVFCYPNEDTKEIYRKYNIEKCYMYQNLTDTLTAHLFFFFLFVVLIHLLLRVKLEK